MKTLLTIFTLVFTLIFSSTSFAEHDFTYKNVFACGPKVVETLPEGMEDMGYYVIHDNEQGNEFSIFHHGLEWSSFKKIHYTELHVQRGGERWLTFQKISDSIIRFELHTLQKQGEYLKVLTFDLVGMSAVLNDTWRVKEPKLLVCWKYN